MRLHIANSFQFKRNLASQLFTLWPFQLDACTTDPTQSQDLCPWVACSSDSQCSTYLCLEGECREPLSPLVKFAIVSISLALLFIIFGIVYLTCNTRRMAKEKLLIAEASLRQKVALPGAEPQEAKKPFDIKIELEKSLKDKRQTESSHLGQSQKSFSGRSLMGGLKSNNNNRVHTESGRKESMSSNQVPLLVKYNSSAI